MSRGGNYNFMLGCTLMMIPKVKSLTTLGGNYLTSYFILLINEANRGENPFLPNTNSLCLGHAQFALTNAIPLLLWQPDLWLNLRSLVFRNLGFGVGFGTLIRGRFLAPEMDIQELVFRVDGARSARPTPAGAFTTTVQRLTTDNEEEHMFQTFRNLRILEVDFPFPLHFLGRRSSPVLSALISAVGAPEILHLRGRPFAYEALGSEVHPKLKILLVERQVGQPQDGHERVVMDRHGVRFADEALADSEGYLFKSSNFPALEVIAIDRDVCYVKSGKRSLGGTERLGRVEQGLQREG
ncbi:Fc.00g047890.m01.CDS01 [Cosmosporella sp. VM-42]